MRTGAYHGVRAEVRRCGVRVRRPREREWVPGALAGDGEERRKCRFEARAVCRDPSSQILHLTELSAILGSIHRHHVVTR